MVNKGLLKLGCALTVALGLLALQPLWVAPSQAAESLLLQQVQQDLRAEMIDLRDELSRAVEQAESWGAGRDVVINLRDARAQAEYALLLLDPPNVDLRQTSDLSYLFALEEAWTVTLEAKSVARKAVDALEAFRPAPPPPAQPAPPQPAPPQPAPAPPAPQQAAPSQAAPPPPVTQPAPQPSRPTASEADKAQNLAFEVLLERLKVERSAARRELSRMGRVDAQLEKVILEIPEGHMAQPELYKLRQSLNSARQLVQEGITGYDATIRRITGRLGEAGNDPNNTLSRLTPDVAETEGEAAYNAVGKSIQQFDDIVRQYRQLRERFQQ